MKNVCNASLSLLVFFGFVQIGNAQEQILDPEPFLEAGTGTLVDLDGDSDPDLVVGQADGTVKLYLKRYPVGYEDGVFIEQSERLGQYDPFDQIDVGSDAIPAFVDLDGDYQVDLVLGRSSGDILVYRNDTSASGLVFSRVKRGYNPLDGIVDFTSHSKPVSEDVDGDGDLDLIVTGLDANGGIAEIVIINEVYAWVPVHTVVDRSIQN